MGKVNQLIENLKDAIREPWAWPGGYTKAIYLSDGERICPQCAKDNFREIVWATKEADHSGWGMLGVDIHWEGDPEYCVQCNKELESEYGPVN